jgi:hypothetical protein
MSDGADMKCKYGAVYTANTEAMTSRQAAKFTGISKSAINDHRASNCVCGKADVTRSTAGESEQHNQDGSSSYTRFSDTPWGYEDYR